MGFRLHVAMGDPQAPLAKVRAVLAGHGLLREDGRLRDEVQLVSMGDHFDWGTRDQRRQATDDGLALLEWLAAHPPEQVVLLAGNHDLGRVCELAPFPTDEAFEAAFAQAVAAYDAAPPSPGLNAALLAAYPHVPDAECLARDFSCFSVAQRELVTGLLRAGRFRLGHAHAGLLCVHAGVTTDDFAHLAAAPGSAEEAARALNGWFDGRVAAWTGGALDLSPLHQPGSLALGPARGIFFHRPAEPREDPQFQGPLRRRFDPRRLPSAFPQAVGHIRDKKCRELMPAWAGPGEPRDGPLRSLLLDEAAPRYLAGAHAAARVYFLDGGMLHVDAEHYELFDLDARQPLSRSRSW